MTAPTYDFGITDEELSAAIDEGYFSPEGSPKRHDCKGGANCFEEELRPQMEAFASCFPGRNSMGDIEYHIERHGWMFLADWKKPNAPPVSEAQDMAYSRYTAPGRGAIAMIIVGVAKEMLVEKFGFYINAKFRGYIPGNLGRAKVSVAKFELMARRRSFLVNGKMARFRSYHDDEPSAVKTVVDGTPVMQATEQRHTDGFVGYDKDGHFLHYCHCGKEAGFGYDVSLRTDKLGRWFCRAHRPPN